MAKKIKINNNEKIKYDEKKISKRIINSNKKDLLKILSLCVNAILIIGIITVSILLIHKNDLLKECEKKTIVEDNEEPTCAYKYDWQCSNHFSKEEAKAKFLDENIVFVLEGYGNVYYSYDCVDKLTEGEDFTFWAYNKEAAISQGYKKGKC